MRSQPDAAPEGRRRGEDGSVFVDVAALGGVVVLVVLVLVQTCFVAFGALLAGHAARAGVRAQAVSGDVRGAVESEVPDGWVDDVVVEEGSGWVEVRIDVPALVPGVSELLTVTGFAGMPSEPTPAEAAERRR